MTTELENATQEDSPGKITFTKPELLQKLLDSFQDYRKEHQHPHYQTFKLHLSALTHKILFDTFELKRGFSKDHNWTKTYSRIKYTLADYTSLEENEFYITPTVENAIQAFIDGSNCKTAEEIEFSLEPSVLQSDEEPTAVEEIETLKHMSDAEFQVNFNDFVMKKQITVLRCIICDKDLQPYEIRPHMKDHKISEFLGAE